MNFSDNLIKLRKGKSWSQEDLAEKLGISRQAVSKWEVGTSKPDIDNVIKISKLFEVSIDELVNNEIIKTEAISINVIYKFAMLFTITQAELQYKELDNYHYVITSYNNNNIIEKEECWYKDGVSKTVNVLFQEDVQKTRTICIDYNLNYGYTEGYNLEKSLIDVDKYMKANDTALGKNQLYLKLPVEIKNENIWNNILNVLIYSKMDINIRNEEVLFLYENSVISLEKGTMKPITFSYKDNNSEEYITSFFTIELNCIEELKI